MNAKPRPAGDLEELTDRLAQLRELVRESHEATKDLRAAIREARSLTEEMADACAKAAFDAANAEMAHWAEHVQREMNQRARDLNRAVDAARRHIVKQLTLVRLIPEEGGMRAEFAANLFDADVPAGGPS